MSENQCGYIAHPTSYKWRLFGSLSAPVYTGASVHRCAASPSGANPTKFAVPTSFTERAANAAAEEAREAVGGSGTRGRKEKTRRDEEDQMSRS